MWQDSRAAAEPGGRPHPSPPLLSSLPTPPAPRPAPPPTVGEVSAASHGPQSTGARVTLVGRAGAPFELASFGAGGDRVRATSSIAFSVGRDKTEWIPVDVWGPLATAVAVGKDAFGGSAALAAAEAALVRVDAALAAVKEKKADEATAGA